jgi:YjbE family integral membrane protein
MIDPHQILAFGQVVVLDLSMAGDNAMVVGMAAAGLPPEKRRSAVLAGIAGATVLRILFALFAVQILHLTGLLIAGGLLLLWVGWKMYDELRHARKMVTRITNKTAAPEAVPVKSFKVAVQQIIIADVSMSLDNVLGVAGIARDEVWILVGGLTLSVMMMGLASTLVARLAARHNWVAYLGLAIVMYTALSMIADGIMDVLQTY